ncbi:alcohol dehydrogenase [Brevibacterium salitolerans]|uniref:Alcohol dehydrogenase n=1 Tax=Brevibacterium salitolerans TaxID=1403566 RepID=A0ABN2WT95_9MICO
MAGPGEPVREIDAESPVPRGREVLLRVTHVGVCHTDVHTQEGGYDLGRQGRLSIADRGLEYPAVLGHEIVGEVLAVGEGVEGVSPGERRLVYPWIGCGECDLCLRGDSHVCRSSRALGVFRWGGFASEVLVPDSDCLIDIGDLDPAWAATLACSGLTAYSAVQQALPLGAGDRVMVIGVGGVGLAAVAFLSRLTEAEVIAVDVSAENLAAAARLGAARTVDSSALGNATVAAELGVPVQAVIDFVNTGATFQTAFDCLDKAGTHVPVGLFGGEAVVPTALLPLKSIRIQGSYVGRLRDLRALVAMAQDTDLPGVPITEKSFDLETLTATLSAVAAGTVAGRTVLVSS